MTAIAIRPQNSGFSDSGTPGLARTEPCEPRSSNYLQETQNHLESRQGTMLDSINASTSDALTNNISLPDDSSVKLEKLPENFASGDRLGYKIGPSF